VSVFMVRYLRTPEDGCPYTPSHPVGRGLAPAATSPFPCHSEQREESVPPLEYGSFDSGFASTQDDSLLNSPVIGEQSKE